VITLLAQSEADGWGLVRADDALLLIRPPYTNDSLQAVSPATLDDAITRHGFVDVELVFDSWGDVVAFLREGVARNMASSLHASAEGIATSLVASAPMSVLDRLVAEAESRIKRGETLAASARLLTAVLARAEVVENPERSRRAISALSEALQRDADHRRYLAGVANEPGASVLPSDEPGGHAPLSSGGYGRTAINDYASAVRERHHVLVFAG